MRDQISKLVEQATGKKVNFVFKKSDTEYKAMTDKIIFECIIEKNGTLFIKDGILI